MYKTGVKKAILLLLLPCFFLAGAQPTFMDRHISQTLSMENGLPSNYIDDIYRDEAGFLWLATYGGGLCRYDGYEFMTFSTTSQTPLRSNFVREVREDHGHRLWIATNEGLDILDLATMRTVPLPELEPYRSESVFHLEKDAEGNFWFKTGTTLHRVALRDDGTISGVLSLEDERLGQNELIFKDIDRDGSVWLALQGHLFRVNVNPQGELEVLPRYPDLDLGENTYLSDFLQAGQELWISSETGIFRLHRASGEWKNYTHDPDDPESLTQNFITSLSRTGDGVLIATSLFGFNVYNPITDNFTRIGNVVVVVAREADWEASPRVATLVYAGTEKSLNTTYWGKKVN